MEAILKEIEGKDEERIRDAFKIFNEENKTNFKLGENQDTRELFCSVLFSHFSERSWSHDTTALALTALRIYAREDGGSFLRSREGLYPLIRLAGLDTNEREMRDFFFESQNVDQSQVNVMVEAVKCLCNIVLNNRDLAGIISDLGGALAGLGCRLRLYHSSVIPYDVTFFDLRFLFLITACGPEERIKLRDTLNGVPTLISVIHSALFGPKSLPMATIGTHELKEAKCGGSGGGGGSGDGDDGDGGGADGGGGGGDDGDDNKVTEPEKDFKIPRVYLLTSRISDKTCLLLNEALKIMFNQTVNWKEENAYNDDELEQLGQLSCLLQLLICSICSMESEPSTLTLNHCCEVVMNLPYRCSPYFLLPSKELVMPILCDLFPSVYLEPQDEEITIGAQKHCCNIDRHFEDSNLAVAVCLLNYLHSLVLPGSGKIDGHVLSIVLGAMSHLSKGNRTIRRFLKEEILPPLKEVKERPEKGDSIKSRLVRLMTAASHDCMDVTAEFLFVLCKENVSRLVKHTGYGNAAGLLLSRGLLGGGSSKGQDDYSSDSEDSDTEEYIKNKSSIDPVTGAPSVPKESPLDHMTPEEIDIEAEKLGNLFDKLNRQGIFKMIPVDKDNNPVNFPSSKDSKNSSSDEEK